MNCIKNIFKCKEELRIVEVCFKEVLLGFLLRSCLPTLSFYGSTNEVTSAVIWLLFSSVTETTFPSSFAETVMSLDASFDGKYIASCSKVRSQLYYTGLLSERSDLKLDRGLSYNTRHQSDALRSGQWSASHSTLDVIRKSLGSHSGDM